MATLTIRKIPDEQIQQLKEVAEKNNRSMESQVRSILEEWLAGTVVGGCGHFLGDNHAAIPWL